MTAPKQYVMLRWARKQGLGLPDPLPAIRRLELHREHPALSLIGRIVQREEACCAGADPAREGQRQPMRPRGHWLLE